MGVPEMNEPNATDHSEVLALLKLLPSPPDEPLPPGASESEIAAFEESQGIAIPTELRQWLTTSNGACVGPGGIVGIKTARDSQDAESILELHPTWANNGWMPVAGDGCGSYYLMATKNEFGAGNPVFFVDVNDDDRAAAFIAGSNVWRFLVFLFKKELGKSNWPFSESEVLADDPEIMSFSSLALPWES